MEDNIQVSLVIPVFNESLTIGTLLTSIQKQSYQPVEVIFVDGGSTDNTIPLLYQLIGKDSRYKVIEAGRAMPGKGRNIGCEAAISEWIAFTDAGIQLDTNWLEHLVIAAKKKPDTNIVYGNYGIQLTSFFEKCAAITYVPAALPDVIRGKTIVSCLLKKETWAKAGGFPDWRATEDLVFMEKAEQVGKTIAFSPSAMVYWQLRPSISTTFKKFDLYSKYNVWAGRQAYWHYGIAKQYLVMLLVLIPGFLHSWYWLLLLPLWVLARVSKRIVSHRFEFGWKPLFNPFVFLLVGILTITIDAATFSGWIKALLQKNGHRKTSIE